MMNPRVICAEVLNQHQILVTFNNQEQRIFDVSEYWDLPVFQILRNPSYFNRVQVQHGTLTWSDDVDFCPDTVYLKSTPLNIVSSQATQLSIKSGVKNANRINH